MDFTDRSAKDLIGYYRPFVIKSFTGLQLREKFG
jgi:hypothetical protein